MNDELHIGARRFKCTTIPIVRSDSGRRHLYQRHFRDTVAARRRAE